MKINDVKELLSAGFTADEIRGMEAAPDPAPEGAAPEGAAPDPAPEPAQNNQDPAVSESVKALSETVKELQKTIKEMQAANISGARQDPKPAPTAEDAIKNFLSRM